MLVAIIPILVIIVEQAVVRCVHLEILAMEKYQKPVHQERMHLGELRLVLFVRPERIVVKDK